MTGYRAYLDFAEGDGLSTVVFLRGLGIIGHLYFVVTLRGSVVGTQVVVLGIADDFRPSIGRGIECGPVDDRNNRRFHRIGGTTEVEEVQLHNVGGEAEAQSRTTCRPGRSCRQGSWSPLPVLSWSAPSSHEAAMQSAERADVSNVPLLVVDLFFLWALAVDKARQRSRFLEIGAIVEGIATTGAGSGTGRVGRRGRWGDRGRTEEL